jgi:pimeloyl-ACP methyl ester carboxylesterase
VHELKSIKTPTLLIWGKNDHSTPLADGRKINLEIEKSKLMIFDDCDHRAPYQNPDKFAKITLDFIGSCDESFGHNKPVKK